MKYRMTFEKYLYYYYKMFKVVERLTIPLAIIISQTNVSYQDNRTINNITINNTSTVIIP